MLDLTQPCELDDGTPVEIKNVHYSSFTANVPKGMYRPEWEGRKDRSWNRAGYWSFNIRGDKGIFAGGSEKSMFYIRNADLAHTFIPEDWS